MSYKCENMEVKQTPRGYTGPRKMHPACVNVKIPKLKNLPKKNLNGRNN